MCGLLRDVIVGVLLALHDSYYFLLQLEWLDAHVLNTRPSDYRNLKLHVLTIVYLMFAKDNMLVPCI